MVVHFVHRPPGRGIMPDAVKRQKEFSESMYPQVIQLLAGYTFRISSIEEDTKHGMDIIARDIGGKSFGVRIRDLKKEKERFFEENKYEVTFRMKGYSGYSGEFQKIKSGNCADLFFYCIVKDHQIICHHILDNSVVRRIITPSMGTIFRNNVHTPRDKSVGLSIDLREMPPGQGLVLFSSVGVDHLERLMRDHDTPQLFSVG